jgi:hypothetical protein
MREFRAEWKATCNRLWKAEDRLSSAWMAFSDGTSDAPSKDLIAEVSRLRQACDRRLAALLEMDEPQRTKQRPKDRPSA